LIILESTEIYELNAFESRNEYDTVF
jgi:hypothetical protein